MQLGQHVTDFDGLEAEIAVHAAAINAGMKRTDTALHDAIAVVPWREPVGFAGAENGDHVFAECSSEVGGQRIVTKHGVSAVQGGGEG